MQSIVTFIIAFIHRVIICSLEHHKCVRNSAQITKYLRCVFVECGRRPRRGNTFVQAIAGYLLAADIRFVLSVNRTNWGGTEMDPASCLADIPTLVLPGAQFYSFPMLELHFFLLVCYNVITKQLVTTQ